ncbi:MAG TPA: hypothetical protein G4O00_09885 [Thermoflexia bacterium]|nr:hypothetical protein [Thermoflexia bacterium]
MSEKMPLKVFLEAVERRLAECSADELRDILRAMAQRIPPADRQAFLAQLGVGEVAVPPPQAVWEHLLSDIDDLALEIRQAMDSADEWEERHGWDYEYEETDLGPYERFVEPLTLLFERAAVAFDSGEVGLALEAYDKLFDLLGLEDDYGRGIRLSDLPGVDDRETVGRYLRAVYETASPDRRPQALYDQMREARFWLGPFERPMLDDLVQISPHPLPDLEAFLTDWIGFLRTQSGTDADAWLREAVRMAEGMAGLEALARTEGRAHPRAYLDWFAALEEEERYAEVLVAAEEALEGLPPDLPIRAAIADHLCSAAAALGDPERFLFGRWEAFRAKPTLSRLLDLWEAVPTTKDRVAWMERAVKHVEGAGGRRPSPSVAPFPYVEPDGLEQSADPDHNLLVHARLLACDVEAARRPVINKPVLGWSGRSSDQALVLSFILILLSRRSLEELPPNLASLWSWSLLATSLGLWGYGEPGEGEEELPGRLNAVYRECLAWGRESGRLDLDGQRERAYLAWCLGVAHRRVKAIVGNQHRRSYGKAAMLTVACAEVLRLRGGEEAARQWVEGIRNRFPRHRAFQAQLRSALQQSG